MEHRSHEPEKVLLTVTSLTVGVLAFILYLLQTGGRGISAGQWLLGLLVGLFAALGYAVAGGLVVRLHTVMRAWAYRGDVIDLTSKEKLRLATFWPVTLFTSLVVYLFLGVINRIF